MRRYHMPKEEVLKELYQVDGQDLFTLINENVHSDDYVYLMEDFDDCESSSSKLETIGRWTRGYRYNSTTDNNESDPYFAYNSLGNITTIAESDLCNWLMENVDNLDPIIDFLYDKGFLEDEDEEDEDEEEE